MSHIDVPQPSIARSQPAPTLDGLMIISALPVVLIAGAVLVIAGGVNLSFLIPAVVCGAMVGMLTFISMRDRTRPD